MGFSTASLDVTVQASPNPRAKLLVEIPATRYRVLSPEGRAPRVGDTVVLVQGFTGPDGLPMVLVYFPPEFSGRSLYEAEVYESELK